MNVIANLVALLIFLFFSYFCFATLGVDFLGYTALGLALLFIARIFWAFQDDVWVFKGDKDE